MSMRLMALIVLLAAVSAEASLCGDCKGQAYTKDIGRCTACDEGRTMSGQFKLCGKCSAKQQKCEHCLKPLAAATTRPAAGAIDPEKDGTYTAGRWEYRYTITNKGTRSQGYHGDLLFDGKSVAEGAINDYHQTPWGAMYWVGRPVVLFGGHGWMMKAKTSAGPGKQLPDPAGAPGR